MRSYCLILTWLIDLLTADWAVYFFVCPQNGADFHNLNYIASDSAYKATPVLSDSL